MKNKHISFLLFSCLVFFTISCSDMNSMHQEYLDKGEIIYAAKVDSIHTLGGNKRMKLELFMQSQRIDKLRIYWNNYKDSTDLVVGGKTGKVSTVINNLEENNYVFDVVSFDKFGNRSLPYEEVGSVYGDNYQSGLLTTNLSDISYITYDTLQFTIGGVNDNLLGYEMKYYPLNGTTERWLRVNDINKLLGKSTDEFKLAATIDPAHKIKWRTAYIPQVGAIDTFYNDWTEYDPPQLLSPSTTNTN